jgi:hypothetical protein
MTKKVSSSSVQNEQFGNTENTENPDKKDLDQVENTDQDKSNETSDMPENDTPDIHESADESTDTIALTEDETSSGSEVKDQKPDELSEIPAPHPGTEESVDDDSSHIWLGERDEDEMELPGTEDDLDDLHTGGAVPKFIPEKVDYTKLSKEDIVKVLKDLMDTGYVAEIRKEVEAAKSAFYRKHKAEVESIRKKFLEEGGQIQDFKVEESPVEIELKELLDSYRELKGELTKKSEGEKEKNLKEKMEIIERIKELINNQESLNKTFHDFHDLQNRWKDSGPVPQSSMKDLWESYHYHVEAFYDYIKINKELRDLDFKRNLEGKIRLCEAAENLLLEPSVVEAFRKLQKLHDQWREIGPVPVEKRSELWERFKEATTKINRKHQEYFVNLKQDQKKNLEEKLLLCEKAEDIANHVIEDPSAWEEKSRELVELQKIWKRIGFAPKKFNTQVYERFRKACDSFFEKKREHYSHNKEEQMHNLQIKTDICVQAELLQNSTDWKKTSNELIALQKKWKQTGPVPAKYSDKIWKRFRGACDTFFNNKTTFFSQIDTHYDENLEMKNKLIEEIEKFEPSPNVEKNLEKLKELQRKWSEIGYVPLKEKNETQDRYRQALNAKFDSLKLDENKKAILKFRNRVEGIIGKPNAQHRLRMEREKCFTKLKQLETDITLWENNIGFFANSENAESMIKDVHQKIEASKNKIEQLKGKIRLMDEYEE